MLPCSNLVGKFYTGCHFPLVSIKGGHISCMTVGNILPLASRPQPIKLNACLFERMIYPFAMLPVLLLCLCQDEANMVHTCEFGDS